MCVYECTSLAFAARLAVLLQVETRLTVAPVAARSVDADLRAKCLVFTAALVDLWRKKTPEENRKEEQIIWFIF